MKARELRETFKGMLNNTLDILGLFVSINGKPVDVVSREFFDRISLEKEFNIPLAIAGEDLALVSWMPRRGGHPYQFKLCLYWGDCRLRRDAEEEREKWRKMMDLKHGGRKNFEFFCQLEEVRQSH